MQKRSFGSKGESEGGKKKSKEKQFVVQKHQASRLHYDLRLQIGNILASWTIPKGPSLSPKDKRLAIEVGDHPIAYADFEGTIPPDNYGAGTVMVWDKGTYRYLGAGSINLARKNGHIDIELMGEKLKGGFTLHHIGNGEGQWLLIKQHDQYAGKSIPHVNRSVKSGKTFRELKKVSGGQ